MGTYKQKQYKPNCKVCQYMKANPGFKYQIMKSKYFSKDGTESANQVLHRWNDPFPATTLYNHIKRHQKRDLIALREQEPSKAKEIMEAVESEVVPRDFHEKSLDKFIRMGDAMIETGELKVTAPTYIAAIKTKADIEKSTKDRRLEAAKAFFNGQTKTTE